VLIDTHCHADCSAFDADRSEMIEEARAAGVAGALVCAGEVSSLGKTARIARACRLSYALGMHPMYLPAPEDADRALSEHRAACEQALSDPCFAAVGEIGLDGFVAGLDMGYQERLFAAQLKTARDLALPVSVHARHAVDKTAMWLARIPPSGGVVHAFNGSIEQARKILSLGLKLGFGGALAYRGSQRIRRIFCALPADAFVLETDAPDMPGPERRSSTDPRTHIGDILGYARIAAELRACSLEDICRQSTENALQAFPRMAQSLEPAP
jgi:TatD DNase family protein